MFRYELIAFKSMIEINLPDLHKKIKQIGLPLEVLILEPIMSMYVNFFSTDIVLRIWDCIFLAFSSPIKDRRKVGLWYLLAPSFMILKRYEKEFLIA